MLRRKCKSCGTLHPADHANECTGCGDPIESLLAICVTHSKLAGSPLALACPACKEAARLNSLSVGTEGGERSDELLRVLETCVMYLISLDGKISSKEQMWIDECFAEGVSDSMIQTISVIDFDWGKHFETLKAQLSALSDVDKEYIPMVNDLVRMSIIQIVAQTLFYIISPDKISLLSGAFIKTLIFICIGIVVYWLLVRKIIIFI